MCRNTLMIESDIIQSLLDDLLDQICSITNPNSKISIPSSPMYYSSQMIENRFNQSLNFLNNSLKQLLTYEMKTVGENGHLNAASNIRHSRYYNPATTIRQMNDLKKKLHWIQQRQFIVKQLNLNQQEKIQETNVDLKVMDNLWLNQRLKMLENSLELIKKEENIEENQDEDDYGCARCRIYQRKQTTERDLFRKIKQFHREHNYSNNQLSSSTPESDLIHSLSRVADRLGQISHSHPLNSSKKLPSTMKKKQVPPKLHSSMSLIVENPPKLPKRTLEESRTTSNSNFLSNSHSDLSLKRQKRIASPQSTTGTSSHDILTPTWRVLNKDDLESIDQQETHVEDISDESYIRRHIRCELEQETWLTNSTLSLNSNRKSGTLQTSISLPNSLSSNGLAYS